MTDRLLATFFLAALLHGLLILGLTFDAAAGGSSAASLQVLLVSDEIPESEKNDSATYLAQRTQKGSGNTDEAVTPRNDSQPQLAPVPPRSPAEETTAEPQVLFTTAPRPDRHVAKNKKPATDGIILPDLPDLPQPETPSRPLEEESGPAQLSGPQSAESLLLAADTRSATLAPYLDRWRRKVERIGTINYPTAALRHGVQASPVLDVEIAFDGTLQQATISRSSGYPHLDQAALEILKLASPFDPFPAELAREHKRLRFAYEWQFVGGRMQGSNISTAP